MSALERRADPRSPALEDGLAPNTTALPIGEARLCGVCVTLIREWGSTWRHAIVGRDRDHAPDPGALDRLRAERDPEILTESELRLMDGNR